MEKEKKLSICSKFISALIIVMVIISSYGTFLSEVAAAVSEYENQKTEAGDRKVNFDAYLKNGEDKVHMAEVNTKDENYLYFNISLREGIIQNAKITLNNPNFAIDYEGLKANTFIKSVNETENSIELNQISENIEVPVKISYKAGDKINLTDLARDTEITLEGTYTDSQKSNKKISGKIAVNLKWISSIEGSLQTNVDNYIEADGKSIVITNTLGIINNITVPMEYVEFSSNVPEINGIIPEEIEITENGNKLPENEFSYDKENKTLVIRKENTSNENNEINNLLGNINYDVIYIYGSQFNLDKVNFDVKQNLKVKPYNVNETNISFENSLEKDKTNQTTKVDISSADNISKGYMYWQKYETPYDVNMNVQIQYILPNRNIEITEKENTLLGDETNLNITNKTSYTRTTISKVEITEILGENGSLEIYDENTGKLIITINKDTQADEQGNIVVNYENVSRIKIVIKDPAKIGNIHINSSKKIISNHGISNDTLKTINNLKLVFETNNMIYSNTTEKYINLYNTVTKSTMEIDKTEFYTTDNETNLNIKLNLMTNSIDYDLYKNPKLSIKFPNEFETIKINSVGMSFENGLKIGNRTVATNEDGTKMLYIDLIGEQNDYNNNQITANTQISINATIKVNNTLSSRDAKIIYNYTNEKAITYDNNGVQESNIKISAPYGLVMLTKANNETSKTKELNSIEVQAKSEEQIVHIEEQVINNYDGDVSNLEITGMIPLKDKKYLLGDYNISSNYSASIAGNIGINRNDAEIEFSSDNQNWVNVPTADTSLFKIKFKDSNFKKGDIINISYDLKVPANITYNKNGYLAFVSNANKDNSKVSSWSGINLSTANMLMEDTEPQSSTVVDGDLKTEISVIQGNESLQENQVVYNEQILKYNIKVTNTTNKDISNIKLTAKNTNSVFYEFVIEQNGENQENHIFKEVPEKSQQDFTIDKLAAGESKELDYQVVVRKGDTDTTQATISLEADNIAKKEIKSISNKIIDAKLKIVTDPDVTVGYPDTLVEGAPMYLGTSVENLTNETLNDIKVIVYCGDFINKDIDSIQIPEDYRDRIQDVKFENGILTFTIQEIQQKEKMNIVLHGFFNSVDENKNNYVFAIADYGDEQYISNQTVFNVQNYYINLNANLTANISTDIELNDQDDLKYTATITNTGDYTASISVSDSVPKMAQIDEVYYMKNNEKHNVDFTINNEFDFTDKIEPNETITLVIDTTVSIYLDVIDTIENSISISSSRLSTPMNSNTLTHTIHREGITTDPEEPDPENPDPENPDPENPDPENPDPENPDPENPNPGEEESTYSISGTAWIDSNRNGQKEGNESRLSELDVRLITNSGDIVAETVTGNSGNYRFDNVSNGSYKILIEYDSGKYGLAPYQRDGVAENINSDFMKTRITENGVTSEVAATETLNVENNSIVNIDIGLIEYEKHELVITKTLEKAVVKTNKRTRTYNFNGKQIGKVEIAAKEMPNAEVTIQYNINITNNGELEEYVNKIEDTPTEGELVSSSEGWTRSGDTLVYGDLAGKAIQPGQTETITLELKVKLDSQGTGKTINNVVKITENTNDDNVSNINDTNATAQFLIGVKTGGMLIGSIVIVGILIVAIAIIVIIKKKGVR